jgi:prophage regulatory protein
MNTPEHIADDPLRRTDHVLQARGGIKRTQHHYDVKGGLWTPPIKLGHRTAVWPDSEVWALNAARALGKTDHEIRELVKRLTEARRERFAAVLAAIAPWEAPDKSGPTVVALSPTAA